MTDDELAERCAAFGLRLRGFERRGAILLLKPDGIDDLPAAADLRALAAELRAQDGVSWVSLDLEDAI